MSNGTIQAWSPTLLQVFENCRFQAKLKAIDRIPEPERPPLPNGQEYPNDRGSRLHDEAEAYIKGEGPFTQGLRHFRHDFEALADLNNDGLVITEQLWCFDIDWNTVERTSWDEHWARIKIDALAFLSPTHAVVVDYKSGRKHGNEIKHGDQVLTYAVTTLLKHPDLEHVTVELWYLDQDELTQKHYTREQAMRFLKSIERRGTECTTATDFPPNPSRMNCRFCPYKTGKIGKHGPEGTGHCIFNPDQ